MPHNVEQQVVGVLDIIVCREVEPATESGEIDTDVRAQGAFPLQVGIADGHRYSTGALTVIVRAVIAVSGQRLIGVEIDIAQISYAGTKLQQLDRQALHELLIVQVPSSTCAPERCKTAVPAELRRTFIAINQIEKILVVPYRVGIDEESHAGRACVGRPVRS